MADSKYAQFAMSEPAGPDAAFWNQKVYFDGVPRRRREIVPTLAATPYMTEKAARLPLTTAPVADGQPAARPPAAWFTTGVIPTPGGAVGGGTAGASLTFAPPVAGGVALSGAGGVAAAYPLAASGGVRLSGDSPTNNPGPSTGPGGMSALSGLSGWASI